LLPNLDSSYATGALTHADKDNCDLSDFEVFGFDHYNHSGGHSAKKGLTVDRLALYVVDELRLIKEVSSWYEIHFFDLAIDRGVPSVVKKSVKESLIHCSTLELFNQIFLS
jgi:hypothetical protein